MPSGDFFGPPNRILNKATPAARRGRKATGLIIFWDEQRQPGCLNCTGGPAFFGTGEKTAGAGIHHGSFCRKEVVGIFEVKEIESGGT